MITTAALSVDRDGAVAEVRLCRADLLNRFDEALVSELRSAITELAEDPGVRAVLWTADGKHFSAGGDMESMLAVNADPVLLGRQIDSGRALFRTFADFPKPLVVALHGNVFGVGTSLVLSADAIVSAPQVQISDSHVHMALSAGDGGCVVWPANLPLATAKRMLIWGDALSAQDAHRMGLITDLVDRADQVEARARALAEQVATLPPMAVQMTKRTLNKVLQARADEVLDLGFYLESLTASTGDVREAVEAFRDRRDPTWRGR